jgi:hypothetical protein
MNLLLIFGGVLLWTYLGYRGVKLLLRKGYEPGSGGAEIRNTLAGTNVRWNESDPFEPVMALFALGGPILLLVATIIPKKKKHYTG